MPNVDLQGHWISTPEGEQLSDVPVMVTPPPATAITTEVELESLPDPGEPGGPPGGMPIDALGPLPQGWTQISDSTGKSVYYNATTQQSTYDRPTAPAAAASVDRSCCGVPSLL